MSSAWPSPNAHSGTGLRSTGSTPRNQQTLKYSCALCKKRKVRCDRADPCSGCVDAGEECVTSTRAPYRRRKRLHSETEGKVSGQSSNTQQNTTSWSIDVANKPGSAGAETVAKVAPQIPTFGQNLWTGLNDEFRDPRGTKPSIDEASHSTASGSPFSDPTAFLFATSPDDSNFRDSYPPPVHAFMLWETFLQNINPLSKLIYTPTVRAEVLEASRDFGAVTKGSAALLFAIYAAAVTSMKDDECQSKMGESRTALLVRYITATQQALAAAGFMKSLQIVVLQAFTIYLLIPLWLSVRQLYDPHAVWLLTGMAVRMGQRIKLDNDRESSGFSVFEVEIRRRIWWQILLIDSRSGQLSGSQSPLLPDSLSFPLPANLNDSDIDPDMTVTPPVHKGATEMIFCLLRYEFGKFLNANSKKLSSPDICLAEKDRLIDEFESYLECNFLRYCDPAIPLHLLSVGGARSGICKMRLMAHHPCQYPDKGISMPQSERDLLFSMSLRMVEYDVLGKSTKILENFSWHLDVYFQMDAFVFMLIELRNQPSGPLADKAWNLVSEIYKYRPKLIDDQTNDLYVAVGQLTLRVWDARNIEIVGQELETRKVPSFIRRLQSEMAKSMTGRTNSLCPSTNPLPKDFVLQANVEHNTHQADDFIIRDSAYQNSMVHIGHMDSGLYSGGAGNDNPSGWEVMDWDFWNNLLEGNMVQQTATYMPQNLVR